MLTTLCAVQIVCWTVLPAIVDTAPPTDVVEGYMWGREWLVMSYKHPQLPCWLLEISRLLTGSVRWPEYALSQISTCTTFILIYAFARDILGQRRALASALLLPAVFFFNSATQQYNHDTAQLPFWAAIVWTLWRASETNRPAWWIALGVAAGLGMHAKFSTGLLVAFGALWLLSDSTARHRLTTPWPWLGLIVFVGLAAPLWWALERMDFLPFSYVGDRADWVIAHRSRFYFIGVQLAAHIGLFVVLIASGLLRLPESWRSSPATAGVSPQESQIEARAWRYLLWLGLGPASLLMIVSLFEGIGEAWATPMFNLSSVLAIGLLGNRLSDRAMMRIAIGSLAVTLLMSGFYAGNIWTTRNNGAKLRSVTWPMAELSERMQTIWRSATHTPLKIVGGANWPAMLVGVAASDEPSIFTDLDTTHAPWITRERLSRDGMLVLWRGDDQPAWVKPWLPGRAVRTELFTWSPKAPPIDIHYVIVPPQSAPPP